MALLLTCICIATALLCRHQGRRGVLRVHPVISHSPDGFGNITNSLIGHKQPLAAEGYLHPQDLLLPLRRQTNLFGCLLAPGTSPCEALEEPPRHLQSSRLRWDKPRVQSPVRVILAQTAHQTSRFGSASLWIKNTLLHSKLITLPASLQAVAGASRAMLLQLLSQLIMQWALAALKHLVCTNTIFIFIY